MSQGGQQPHVVPWDRPVWRVARRTDPVAFSRIEAAEATVDAGNRFDVRGGAVLYTGGSLECCFVETMARLRTSPAVVQAVGCDEHYMNPDTVPISWRTNRCIVTVAPVEGGYSPFIDLDHPDTIDYLDRELRGQLDLHGVSQLDRRLLYSSDRRLTRLISEWAYTRTDPETGYLMYGGIRYESRLSSELVCWAIFDGLPMDVSEAQPIEKDNESLLKVADRFGLTIM